MKYLRLWIWWVCWFDLGM